MIYLIGNKEEKVCKIGYTRNLETLGKRLSSLRTGNHLKLEIFEIREGTRHLEKAIHFVLSEYRLEGEWFLFNEMVKNKFKSIKAKVKVSRSKNSNVDITPMKLKYSFWKTIMCRDLMKSDLELLSYIMPRYTNSKPFNINEYLKKETSKLTGRSPISYNTCTKRLINSGIVLPVNKGSRTYIINPEFTL